MRRIFARISPNLPEKFLCTYCPQIFAHKDHEDLFSGVTSKKGLKMFFCNRWAPRFEVKQRWAPFLPGFSGILPKFSVMLPRCPDFQRICPIYEVFCPYFWKIRILGYACTPALPPPTPLLCSHTSYLTKSIIVLEKSTPLKVDVGYCSSKPLKQETECSGLSKLLHWVPLKALILP